MKNPDDIIICRCEDVTYGEIVKAIENGAKDINSIKKLTRAGMGNCQGHVCEILIQTIMLEKNKKIDTKELFLRRRPPILNIKMEEMARLNE